MRKFILLSIIVCISPVVLVAQNNKINKLEGLYKKNKYEKCLKYSNKITKKYPGEAYPYYIKSIIYTKKFTDEISENNRSKYLKYALREAFKAKRKDVENKYASMFQIEMRELHDSALSYGKEIFYNGKSSKSKFYFDYLVKIYEDTTVEFLSFTIKNVSNIKHIASDDSSLIQRVKLISNAGELVGIPYRYGGEDKNGFDCSGFVKYVFQSVGIEIPHNANMQEKLGELIELDDALPGDMIFIGYYNNKNEFKAYHAGVILTNENGYTEIIHCVSGGVSIAHSDTPNFDYWMDREHVIKRIIGVDISKEEIQK